MSPVLQLVIGIASTVLAAGACAIVAQLWSMKDSLAAVLARLEQHDTRIVRLETRP